MAYSAIIPLTFATLGITTRDDMLQSVDFLPADVKPFVAQTSLAREVTRQFQAYCRDSQFCFDLPLPLSATAYQQTVREALLNIPVGNTLTYSGLAEEIGSGARAVAMACRHNPFPIIVPCHRVVAKTGLGGYAGATRGKPVEIKRWLLEHEHANHS